MGNTLQLYKHPDTFPRWDDKPSFDSQYGFPAKRKDREMKVTEEEMVAANVKLQHRDYCAHHLIEFYNCKQINSPYAAACKAELSVWKHCLRDDYELRMMEFERERRLRERAKRKGTLANGQNDAELPA